MLGTVSFGGPPYEASVDLWHTILAGASLSARATPATDGRTTSARRSGKAYRAGEAPWPPRLAPIPARDDRLAGSPRSPQRLRVPAVMSNAGSRLDCPLPREVCHVLLELRRRRRGTCVPS